MIDVSNLWKLAYWPSEGNTQAARSISVSAGTLTLWTQQLSHYTLATELWLINKINFKFYYTHLIRTQEYWIRLETDYTANEESYCEESRKHTRNYFKKKHYHLELGNLSKRNSRRLITWIRSIQWLDKSTCFLLSKVYWC